MSYGIRRALAGTVFVLSAGPAVAQQFVNQGALPGTARWTEGVECADVDKDGDLDIFFAEGEGFMSAGTQRQAILIVNKFVENGGIVGFADESNARLGVHLANGKGVATGDVNADGWVDALFANGFANDVPFLFINQGASNPGFFNMESAARGFTTNLSSGGGQFGDLDDDGDLDLIITDAYFVGGSGKPRLYINDGTGVFTDNSAALVAPNKTAQMDVQLVDIDNDWDLDFFGTCRAGNGGINHYLLTNDGTATFSDQSSLLPATSTSVYEADCGDLDGDTDIDLFFVSLSGFREGAVRNNQVPNGTLSFTSQALQTPAVDDNEIAMCDIDVDGDYDILVGSLGSREYVYRNDGAYPFTDVSAASINPLSDSTLDCTLADLDNDGRYDFITAQGESNPGQWANKWYKNGGAADTLAPVIYAVSAPVSAPVGDVIVKAKIRDQVVDDGVNYVTGSARYVVNRTPQAAAVSIDPGTFTPAVLTIAAGTTVTWTNNSGVGQSVDLGSAPYNFASGAIANGGTYAYAFVKPGTYAYSTTGGFNGSVVVTGGAATVDGFYAGGQLYRFSMSAPSGSELVYELEFRDWAGNVSVTKASTISLTGGGCPTPTTYCTAKVNSQGCTPVIASNGTPSASSGSGFFVSASQVINNKTGLFFYSLIGQQANSFQGGFLCVKLPIKRTTLQTSGGNPPPNDCSGAYNMDFNAYVASGVDPALISGMIVNGQYWARDPADAFTTSLSNGLSFTLCP